MINNVAYCGLYCPKCYKNSVSDAAEELKRTILQTKNICGKAALISQEMEKELDSLIGLRCVNFCRAGGGKSDCKIKLCCLDKKIDGCWQCDSFVECGLLSDRFKGNVSKIKQQGIEQFITEYQF